MVGASRRTDAASNALRVASSNVEAAATWSERSTHTAVASSSAARSASVVTPSKGSTSVPAGSSRQSTW